jgi:hypothetical protein
MDNSDDNNITIQLKGKNPDSANSQAIISATRSEHILEHTWYLGKDNYPFAYIKGARVPLHRFVWYIKTGNWSNGNLYVDHVNRNKLDATYENLRLASPAENSYNKTSKNNLIDPITNEPLHHIKLMKSGYSVSLSKNGKINKINKIGSLEEAKEIYNMMAQEMFGEFAVLY